MKDIKAFIHCTLLDGTSEMEPQDNITVVVKDGRISAVGKGMPAPEGAEVYDLAGQYLMPGLINLHVHLPGTGVPAKKQKDAAKTAAFIMRTALTRSIGRAWCAKQAETELLSGVTTIRTVGGLGTFDSEIRDKINAGKAVGPRILSCDMAISVPGGHMAGSVSYIAESEEDCRRLVKKIIAAGHPDWIKLMITGGVLDAKVKGEPGVLKMPPAYVKAACEEAHKAGFRVAAHTESTEGVKVALENGVDSIEHGAVMTDEIVQLYKEHHAVNICTISPAVPFAAFDREVVHSTELTQYNGQIVMEGIISSAKSALANEIPCGLGTDTACPFVTHYDMWRELEYFHHYCGVTRKFALYTATCRNAEIVGLSQETGTVAVGRSADLLVTAGNPLDDLAALRTPEMVVFRGQVHVKPKVKKYEVCEQELDKEHEVTL